LILNGQTIALPDPYITIASGTLPDFFGGSSLHLTTLFLGFLVSILYVFFKRLDRRSKLKNNFHVPSYRAHLTEVISIFLVINVFMYWLARAEGLPYIVIILVALISIYTFVTKKTVVGRHIYAMGGNAKTAALSGIKTKKILFAAYINMGLMAAVAGIDFAGRLNSSSPVAGVGFELDAIAACFIGGASATGGVGTIIGAIIGGLIMGILNNGMSIMGINIFWQSIVKGMVLLLAVAFDVYSKSKSK
jgi:putative multiple sugar transport system permease protein